MRAPAGDGLSNPFSAAPGAADKTMLFLGYEVNALTTICFLLFMGAMGKSAQFLLHTWLPDAMEGPTPVSALIHAATMVTAGVFMVARLSPLFEYAPVALQVVTLVGAVTAFFAATIGCRRLTSRWCLLPKAFVMTLFSMRCVSSGGGAAAEREGEKSS